MVVKIRQNSSKLDEFHEFSPGLLCSTPCRRAAAQPECRARHPAGEQVPAGEPGQFLIPLLKKRWFLVFRFVLLKKKVVPHSSAPKKVVSIFLLKKRLFLSSSAQKKVVFFQFFAKKTENSLKFLKIRQKIVKSVRMVVKIRQFS